MGDAAEVLGALYEKLAVVAAKAGNPTLLNDNFGLHVQVQPYSGTACHHSDHVLPSLQCASALVLFTRLVAHEQF